jgi:Na+/H+ antiporter NhaD/arsenite permease-like protein
MACTFINSKSLDIIVLFPFHIPVYLPRPLVHSIRDTLSTLRILPPRRHRHKVGQNGAAKPFVRFLFPMNFVTAPLIADLFLLAILAIGRTEVHDGTIGADHISPIDIMVFFITLAYIAISIDASGLIRYLAFKVLQKGGKVGHKLFFFLYVFFFALGTFIGNDPIILSGTAFLAYMTRVSSNIIHPRAWIHTQFAIANISSAILVSSNPTNLVLAGAFGIKFIIYTAHMIVPVAATAIVLFPFLLYIVFADESLIPYSIKMHELSEEAKAKKPVNPNIPNARGNAQEEEKKLAEDKLLSLEEIMNPFLDKGGAAFGAVIMAATLITLLAINAASQSQGEHPVYWVTLPAAFVMFCWEVSFGWYRRHETREIARQGRREIELARQRREEEMREMNESRVEGHGGIGTEDHESNLGYDSNNLTTIPTIVVAGEDDKCITISTPKSEPHQAESSTSSNEKKEPTSGERATSSEVDERANPIHPSHDVAPQHEDNRATLISLLADAYRWCQETFPTVTAVVAHLPFALVPFAFSMFVLVQALVTKGWVPVFAYGWDHWVSKTGTVGAIGGMGFLSVILCNVSMIDRSCLPLKLPLPVPVSLTNS